MVEVVAAVLILVVLAAQAAAVARMRGREPARPASHAAPAAVQSAVIATNPANGRFLDLLRRKRWLRRALSVASTAAILVAVAIIGYPFYTNLQAERLQGNLRNELASPELQQEYTDCQAARQGAAGAVCNIGEGDSLTRIQIPDIDVDVVVVEGVSASALRAGAGHYPNTPLPCETGNVGIAGHRTTYGRPFNNLDLLTVKSDAGPGSMVTLQTPIQSCTYEVIDKFIVLPTDISVIAPTTDDVLTLTTCNPKGSAAQRLIIRARLVQGPPADPA